MIKLNMDPEVLYLDIYPNNENICPLTSLCRNIHNSPKLKAYVLSIGKWINKLWYLHIIEYYSAVKKDNLLIRISSSKTSEYSTLPIFPAKYN